MGGANQPVVCVWIQIIFIWKQNRRSKSNRLNCLAVQARKRTWVVRALAATNKTSYTVFTWGDRRGDRRSVARRIAATIAPCKHAIRTHPNALVLYRTATTRLQYDRAETSDCFHTGIRTEHRDNEGKEDDCSTPPRFGRGRHRQLPVRLIRRHASHDNLLSRCCTLTQYTQPHANTTLSTSSAIPSSLEASTVDNLRAATELHVLRADPYLCYRYTF